MDRPRSTVTAVVLTFNNPEALGRCLAAIEKQSRPPDTVVVVDNAGERPVDDIVALHARASVVRLPENVGPAGGYAAALERFAESTDDWAWLLDDDCVPDRQTLEVQLAAADEGADVVLATMIDRGSGEVTNTQGWCAVLLGRTVVETVGVPDADLFWWTEDTEYLQWRIPRAGFRVARPPDATVEVDRSRPDTSKPGWKYYYEARNQVYYRLRTQRPGPGDPVHPWLRPRVRVGRAARSVTQLSARVIRHEREDRVRKLAMVARGVLDGLRGRLGRTVEVDRPDRPG